MSGSNSAQKSRAEKDREYLAKQKAELTSYSQDSQLTLPVYVDMYFFQLYNTFMIEGAGSDLEIKRHLEKACSLHPPRRPGEAQQLSKDAEVPFLPKDPFGQWYFFHQQQVFQQWLAEWNTQGSLTVAKADKIIQDYTDAHSPRKAASPKPVAAAPKSPTPLIPRPLTPEEHKAVARTMAEEELKKQRTRLQEIEALHGDRIEPDSKNPAHHPFLNLQKSYFNSLWNAWKDGNLQAHSLEENLNYVKVALIGNSHNTLNPENFEFLGRGQMKTVLLACSNHYGLTIPLPAKAESEISLLLDRLTPPAAAIGAAAASAGAPAQSSLILLTPSQKSQSPHNALLQHTSPTPSASSASSSSKPIWITRKKYNELCEKVASTLYDAAKKPAIFKDEDGGFVNIFTGLLREAGLQAAFKDNMLSGARRTITLSIDTSLSANDFGKIMNKFAEDKKFREEPSPDSSFGIQH